MIKSPNTEVSIKEISNAITLRVFFAIVKYFSLTILPFVIFYIITIFLEEGLEWKSSNWHPAWGILGVILVLWAYIYDATKKRSFHSAQWYFPKMNGFYSLFVSMYAVGSAFILFNIGTGYFAAFLFLIFYGIPLFIYYTMLCGYYIVMMRRYPDYENEDFAIPMPAIISILESEEGGISGNDTTYHEE